MADKGGTLINLEPLYYECHITIDPVFDERLEQFTNLCSQEKFKVAKLFMQKGVPSSLDSFCTGHDNDYQRMHKRMSSLVALLGGNQFVVRRYKIEAVIFDTRRHGESNAPTPEMDSL